MQFSTIQKILGKVIVGIYPSAKEAVILSLTDRANDVFVSGYLVNNILLGNKNIFSQNIINRVIWFNGISTLDGYLMLNLVYTYIF